MSNAYRRRTRKRPTVEPLEERKAPSTLHLTASITPAALVRGAHYLFLNGTADGTFKSTPSPIPDLGSSIQLRGHGKLTTLGKVEVSGNLVGTGFIASGNAGGAIKLTNAKGSLTLNLTGPSQPGFTVPQAGTYQFTFEKGTGAYAKDVSDGSVDVSFSGSTFTLTFHGSPNRF